jgi:serine/threonine-protein kinase
VIFGTSSKVPPGFVFSQAPVGRTRVARGSRVAIAVADGKPTVKVPDVVGRIFSDAVARLAAVGLRPQLQNVVASTRPADTVLAQTPEPGTTAEKGSTVALAVSSG